MSLDIHGQQTPSGTPSAAPPSAEQTNKEAFSDAAKTLKGLISLLKKQGDSSEARQLAQEAEGLADSLSSAGGSASAAQMAKAQKIASQASALTGKDAELLQSATLGLSIATMGSYAVSASNPQLNPPEDSSLSKDIMNTISQPALTTKLGAVMSLVMALMREIQQEEAEIQGKSIVEGTKQAVDGANAEIKAGDAQAQQTRNQAYSQIASSVSSFVQGATQLYTFTSLRKDPAEVTKYDKDEIEPAEKKLANTQKLSELRSLTKDYEKPLPGEQPSGYDSARNPIYKTTNQRMNARITELEAGKAAHFSQNPPSTPYPHADELEKLQDYKVTATKFANSHQVASLDTTQITDQYGNRWADDSIPDIKSDKTISECYHEDNKDLQAKRETRTTMLSRSTSKIQTYSQIASGFLGSAEKGIEAGMSVSTANQQKLAAQEQALKQITSNAQGIMQGIQQMSDKGRDGVMQSLNGMIQLMQTLIQTTQQNWQR